MQRSVVDCSENTHKSIVRRTFLRVSTSQNRKKKAKSADLKEKSAELGCKNQWTLCIFTFAAKVSKIE